MKSKLIQIPYTVAIVKPHLVLRTKEVTPQQLSNSLNSIKLEKLYDELKANHFEVFH